MSTWGKGVAHVDEWWEKYAGRRAYEGRGLARVRVRARDGARAEATPVS